MKRKESGEEVYLPPEAVKVEQVRKLRHGVV